MIIFVAIFVAGIIGAAYWVSTGLNAVATLQPGMVELHLPSGATAYMRRQAYFGKPAKVYISANPDFCAPYDRSHDFKLPDVIHGGTESPLLVSYQGNTVILHGPKHLQQPHAPPSSFNVIYQELSPEAYSDYVQSNRLPEGWLRVEVPFGHNTCAL